MSTPPSLPRYIPPAGRADAAFSTAVAWLTDHGTPQRVPVNLLVLDGERYLVAPRGNTQWVRNIRVAGEAELRVGRRVERVAAVELAVDARLPVLRVYLRRWGWEIGKFVEGLSGSSTDAELAHAAPGIPVFRVTSAA